MQISNLTSNKGIFFKGIKILCPRIFEDNRGYFYESWNKSVLEDNIHKIDFCQENHSYSKENVLRGLHFQLNPHSQGKLVECLSGVIFDVIVDLRIKSPTFLQWGGVQLSEKNHKQIWIAKGFAHGFYTLSKEAHVIYKVDNYWKKEYERTIIWNDSNLSINWPLIHEIPEISDKDSYGKKISEISKEDLFL